MNTPTVVGFLVIGIWVAAIATLCAAGRQEKRDHRRRETQAILAYYKARETRLAFEAHTAQALALLNEPIEYQLTDPDFQAWENEMDAAS